MLMIVAITLSNDGFFQLSKLRILQKLLVKVLPKSKILEH